MANSLNYVKMYVILNEALLTKTNLKKNEKKHETTKILNVNLTTITVAVQLQETLRRKEKQWDKERQMMEADKLAAETDARQKDDVIRSKDQLIAQKNELVAEKDAALRDRLEALQQKVYLLTYLFELFNKYGLYAVLCTYFLCFSYIFVFFLLYLSMLCMYYVFLCILCTSNSINE